MPRFSQKDYLRHVHFLRNLTQPFGEPIYPSIEDCNSHLNNLDDFTDPTSFYWVVDLKNQKIGRSKGVFNALGYPDNPTFEQESLTLYDVYYMVHENMQAIIQAQRTKALPFLQKNFKGMTPFSKDYIYTVVVAFQKRNSKDSILVKQKSTPFQLDENGNMLSYLSFHQIIKDYNQEPPTLEIIIHQHREEGLEDMVESVAQQLMDDYFSISEKRVLLIIADYYTNPQSSVSLTLSNQQICDLIFSKHQKKNSVETIKTYKKRIMEKARIHYGHFSFSNIKDLAIVFRNYKLI